MKSEELYFKTKISQEKKKSNLKTKKIKRKKGFQNLNNKIINII
jgi:hypothetical protein